MEKKLITGFWIVNLILVTLFWGATFVFVKDALADIAVTWFLAYRFGSAFLVGGGLSLVYATARYPAKVKGWVVLFVRSKGWLLGLFLYLAFLFQTAGLSMTSPSNAAFITGLSVVLVPLLAAVRGDKLSRPVVVAALAATLGLSFLTLDFSSLTVNVGDVLVLGTAVFLALQIIFTDHYVQSEPPGVVALAQFGSMALLGLVGALVLETDRSIAPSSFSGAVWVALFLTVVFATLYAFGTQTFAQKSINPTIIALVFALEPVFALLTNVWVGQEQLTVLRVTGMSLILLSTVVAVLTQPREDATLVGSVVPPLTEVTRQ